MKLLLRIVAILAAVSVGGTVWFIAAFARGGGLVSLASSGLLGALTLIGWVVTFALGPVVVVQLWKYKESGRLAGIVVFGYGLAYYIAGLLVLRLPEASIPQIVAAATMFALPLVVLLSRRARELCARVISG